VQQAQESGAPLNGPREGGSALLLLFCCVRALPRVSPDSSSGGRSLIPSTRTGWNQPTNLSPAAAQAAVFSYFLEKRVHRG